MKGGISSPTLQKSKIIKEFCEQFFDQKLDNLGEIDQCLRKTQLPTGLKKKQKI